MHAWTPLLILAVALSGQEPEKKVPADSLEIVANGCLKGRVFTATGQRTDENVSRGPDVTGRSFRLSGPKAVMSSVKAQDGHLVEIVGLVRKSALPDNAPGARIGNTRVVIGGNPQRSDPTSMQARSMPVGNYVVMDVTAVRYLSDDCPIDRR